MPSSESTEYEQEMDPQIWLKNYEPGVVHDINPDEFNSLSEWMTDCFKKYQNKPCYQAMGATLSFREVDKLSQDFAHFLIHTCQLKPGERLAIMMPNLIQYPVVMFGALRAGITVVNINPMYTANELKLVLNDSGARAIIVFNLVAHVLQKVLPETRVQYIVVTELGDLLGPIRGALINFAVKYIKKKGPDWDIPDAISLPWALKRGSTQQVQNLTPSPQSIAFIQYTGYTTGEIFGVVLTHRNVLANILQASAWITPFLTKPFHGSTVTALPLYHIFSLMASCFVFFNQGVSNVLICDSRNKKEFIKELKRQPFCFMVGVNTLFRGLLNYPEFHQLDFSHYQMSLSGGMTLSVDVAKKWEKLTGKPLLQSYGLTEASPAVCITPFNATSFSQTVGLPLPSTLVKICNEQGTALPFNEVGELWVKGPQVMQEYWNHPEKTNHVLTEAGWLKTGDLAQMDEHGYIQIRDRKKDLINVSGFKVYPKEIEEIILQIEAVSDVATVAKADNEHGEVVKAYVIRKDMSLTKEMILEHCRQQLTNYKVPKEIEFVNELPRSTVGKILRRELKGRNRTHTKP